MEYKVITLDLNGGLTEYEINAITNCNFLTANFSNSDGNCSISFDQKSNYKCPFINGSKIKGSYEKIYVSAPVQNGTLTLFLGKDIFYEKDIPVNITAVLNNYQIYNYSQSLNNELHILTLPANKLYASISIQNKDTINSVYVGNFSIIADYTKGVEVSAGEIFYMPFNPLSASIPISVICTTTAVISVQGLYL